jgi:hypothetical protein
VVFAPLLTEVTPSVFVTERSAVGVAVGVAVAVAVGVDVAVAVDVGVAVAVAVAVALAVGVAVGVDGGGITVSVSLSESFEEFRSSTPAGGAIVAVFVTFPLVAVTITVTSRA